jgi:hypothetical protein
LAPYTRLATDSGGENIKLKKNYKIEQTNHERGFVQLTQDLILKRANKKTNHSQNVERRNREINKIHLIHLA